MKSRYLAAAALIGGLALAGCNTDAPATQATTDESEAVAGNAEPVGQEEMAAVEQAAAEQTADSNAGCTITQVAVAGASDGMEQVGKVGDLGLFAAGADLMCSDPAGLSGDCQIAQGKTVVAIRGDTAYRITADEPSTYLEYGPDKLECVAPPGPVTRQRS